MNINNPYNVGSIPATTVDKKVNQVSKTAEVESVKEFDKVAHLKNLIEKGEYKIDLGKVAESIADELTGFEED